MTATPDTIKITGECFGREVEWTATVRARHQHGVTIERNGKIYNLGSGKVTSWYGPKVRTILSNAVEVK